MQALKLDVRQAHGLAVAKHLQRLPEHVPHKLDRQWVTDGLGGRPSVYNVELLKCVCVFSEGIGTVLVIWSVSSAF